MRELVVGLAGLSVVVAVVAASVFWTDPASARDPEVPAGFSAPNVIWYPRLPAGKTRVLTVIHRDRVDPDGCKVVPRPTPAAPPPDVPVSSLLAENTETCDQLIETITFDPGDPRLRDLVARRGVGPPP